MQKRIWAAVGVLALSVPSSAAMAASTPDDASSRFEQTGSSGVIDSSFVPSSVGSDGRVTVIVEMTGDPVAVVEAEKGRDLTSAEKSTVKKNLKSKQDSIRGSITGKGGKIQAQMQSAYNGMQISVPVAALDAVAELPGVVAVHPVRTHQLDNAVSVPFLGVPQVWEDTGYTGEGVKVAILDTGIDYTHADFGGPGTVEAFEAAAATSDQPADPALFGPDAPRIKGGIDLVGDDYDAGGEGAALTPHPDANPLDCNGHGSHVAGTTGGSGVTADGETYTGAYDSTTSSNTFRVGPGVAPEVDLYAVRVFGCEGSTDVVVPAIDWAVDNGMDVINMSLGSSFGRGDTPDAVAASNAVGAGVVVVASAGNSGHNPYLTGSPGTGDGVIAVSAVDSSETFPGATVTVDGKAVTAINANGASLDGLGTLEVVRLKDIAGTAEDESLGCSEAAYTANGVAAGEGQLAVSVRGTCARVAKAIYAQQAGAAAALMVNTSTDLPPYEGQITSNPDTGEAYEVTIPFLGVSSTDGPTFVTGATATFASAQIDNPGFRKYASFSSSGPRSGDSGISPDVAAPGVSIASAGVGTGNAAAIYSGTSMAAPHVAGVAALSVQAHPKWSAPDVAASVVSTADPDKVDGQSLTLGGVGLVDAAQAVATTSTATGDAFRTDSGWARESALSLGFQESDRSFGGIKTVTVSNKGKKSVTYTASTEASAASVDAKVSVWPKKVTVRAGGSAKIFVKVSAAASAVPGSLAGDEFSFSEISGDVVLTSSAETLRVPYLVVPRSLSDVSAKTTTKKGATTVTLTNRSKALAGVADFYQWGLSDKKDATASLPDTGYDLRAAGVQSYDTPSGELVVFALSTHKRWSNAAANEYDVPIDVNGDGEADWILLSADSGAVRAGDYDGSSEVFLYEVATGELSATGFGPQAPTDSSTILLPVFAEQLGLTGAFSYSAQTYSSEGGEDAISSWAAYDLSAPAVSNGDYVTVPTKGSVKVPVSYDSAQLKVQKPLGSMVVVVDNKAGASEALLLKR
ncbi:S8 family serine peptidase [Microbacterium fluvii]|uniref:S8 family serine peptidase n=1 Tax=Microbacterium fluvii TaxID=415215 RepID=A0ABW2HAY4_9MICO|nr:S8 family serine peptidase [Microbacterium fluvii]MCU4671256.1 S8 family serine peptidase [Microbacterium fluvii]